MRLPFEGKFERAHNFEREQRDRRESMMGGRDELSPSDMMEKGDGCAMLIAAMVTIVPACLIVVAILAAAGYFFIVR